MTRKINFSVEEFYHAYNRGNSKQSIFLNDGDMRRFQKLLYVCNSKEPVVFKSIQSLALEDIKRGETLVDIGAYCLMPNHFHLLLREKEGGGISAFLQKLSTAYSKYFNTKHERTGSLFEGPFRATHADGDTYLKYLFAYIHLNPVKLIDPLWRDNGIANREFAKNYLSSYSYSSYLDYMGGNRAETKILERSQFPEYFTEFKDFEQYIDSWLSFKNLS